MIPKKFTKHETGINSTKHNQKQTQNANKTTWQPMPQVNNYCSDDRIHIE
jgi:hypothetical protein